MTKEIKTFSTLDDANIEIKKRTGIWRTLHIDFINNQVKVTFVNGMDDPNNSQEAVQRKIDFSQRKVKLAILKPKIDNKTIIFPELIEYISLVIP